jgi:hypothetical protein
LVTNQPGLQPKTLLELNGRAISQGRVQALLIVDAFNELSNLTVSILEVAILGAINPFML